MTDLEKAIKVILQELTNSEATTEHLKDTPRRVSNYLKDACSGYTLAIENLTTQFNSNGYDEIVILKDIDFYSLCSHHMMGISGKAHIGYLPSKKIIGISKLARIVDLFAKRLQVQEELTKNVADLLEKILAPRGLAVVIEAAHDCVRSRGAKKPNSLMITSAMRGRFRTSPAARNEFLKLIGK